MSFFDKLKTNLMNLGLNFISIDEKIVRMTLEAKPSDIKPIVLLPAVEISQKLILKYLENKTKRGKVINGTLNGIDISVILTNVGAPNIANIMECLKRSSCIKAIRIDFCGGLKKTYSKNLIRNDSLENRSLLQTNIDVGDVIIPEVLFLTDGASLQYLQAYQAQCNNLRIDKYPIAQRVISPELKQSEYFYEFPSIKNEYYSIKNSNSLFKYFKHDHEEQIQIGRLWGTDALYCENQKAINTWRLYGCNCVDMESTVLHLLGGLFSIDTISVLSVSDLPDSEEYNLQKTNKIHPGLYSGIKNAVKLVVENIRNITQI
ncbi:MAG: hypothetical protein GF364_14260 [Candidatus Lokiarchaeota archaeon]|nr:hypothetical protein [Candidatus Lokiarchaeota archaeon]